jgi:hypothetical protein
MHLRLMFLREARSEADTVRRKEQVKKSGRTWVVSSIKIGELYIRNLSIPRLPWKIRWLCKVRMIN